MPRIYNLKIERKHNIEERLYHQHDLTTNQPAAIDLRNKWNTVYDQGQLGSCTANALCGLVQYVNPSFTPSRLFLYYCERVLDGDIYDDAGSTISQGVNALIRYGICPESDCPYVINNFATRPSVKAFTDAKAHTAAKYSHIRQDLSSMKATIASGIPFAFGFLVYSSFESQRVARTGIVPYPNIRTERILGGHAVVACGYDDSRQAFLVRNSWGTSWGIGGYCWMPYKIFTDPNMTTDLWVITSVS